jgi:hypothetical protein
MTAGGAQSAYGISRRGRCWTEYSFSRDVDVLPVAVYATDAEGRLTYFNEASRASARWPAHADETGEGKK